MLTNQGSDMDIQLRWRYSVTEALRIAKADSKSSILILLDLSAAFDTINHQILLSTLTSLGITGIPLCWFESYLTGRSFKVAWGGEESRAHQLVTGVPQGSVLGPLLFSTYTTITGSHHTSTWYLLPLLCWWHTALSLISTRWSNGSCTDLSLPGGHLGMDETTPSTAEPGKDWAFCLPGHSSSTTWFYHPDRFINNYPIKLSQNYWGDFRWPAHFQRPHTQKLLDPAGLHCTASERSGPSLHSTLHNFLSRALSFLDWTTAMLFWLDFHHAQSNLYRWFRMLQHD